MLDATVDPDGLTGENEELVVSIGTSLDGKEALKTLEQFYDDWWPRHSNEETDKIAIGLEFQTVGAGVEQTWGGDACVARFP